jgi:hypothetical protein
MPSFEKFANGLFQLGFASVKEFSKCVRYIGGTHDNHRNYLKTQEVDYVQIMKDNAEDSACICGQKLTRKCFLAVKDSLNGQDEVEYYVVGVCCVRRFMPKGSLSRTCRKCEAVHKNRSVDLCNRCRPKCSVCRRFMTPRHQCYMV